MALYDNRSAPVFSASPSLAIIKYWGKQDPVKNTPATSSLAFTLKGLTTKTSVTISDGKDRVVIDDKEADISRFLPFFNNFRNFLGKDLFFHAASRNNFPSSAGLASSSSGFAALAYGCQKAAGINLTSEELSSLARIGSASAARAIFSGFVLFPAGAKYAEQLYDENYWPELRIVVVQVSSAQKSVSSRKAMEATKQTSPFYQSWVEKSKSLIKRALRALEKKDLEALGPCVRSSYLTMFGTMFSAEAPILYWLPESIAVIRCCEELRKGGIQAWETMDAGPQVKILCLKDEVSKIQGAIEEAVSHCAPEIKFIVSRPGKGVEEMNQSIDHSP